ncbi:MAG: hypothetical protein HEQ23_12615 [Tepidisphaera sp.]
MAAAFLIAGPTYAQCDPPVIVRQPASMTRCEASLVGVNVVAAGATSYLWRKDGLPLAGASSSSLIIRYATVEDAGSYDCVVTNDCGSVTTQAATIAIDERVVILRQPSSTIGCVGDEMRYAVEAAGAGPLTFQWQRFTGAPSNGGFENVPQTYPYSGGSTPTLVVAGQPSSSDVNDELFRCRVSGRCNQVLSDVVTQTLRGERWVPRAFEVPAFEPGASIFTICVTADDDVVVGGAIPTVAGVPASNIARWSRAEQAWLPMGDGFNGYVQDVAPLSNGDVLAGGSFTMSGDTPLARIARWSVAERRWLPLGSGMSGGVSAVVELPSGDIVASGGFTTAGGVPVQQVARWNGSEWFPMGNMWTGARSLKVLRDGTLYASAHLTLSRWDGTRWNPIPYGIQGGVEELAELPGGELVATGNFWEIGGTLANNIAMRTLEGTWVPLGQGLSEEGRCLCVTPAGELIVGGGFLQAGGRSAMRIARWSGGEWSALGEGMSNYVLDLAIDPRGDVLAAGSFQTVGGTTSPAIARYTQGLPDILSHPVPVLSCGRRTAEFRVQVSGTGPFEFQWRKDGVALDPSVIPSADREVLTLTGVDGDDRGSYDCVVAFLGDCGPIVTEPATLDVCPLDVTCDGFVDFFDFTAFVTCFEGQQCEPGTTADFNADGFTDLFDFLAFTEEFEVGC